MFTALFSFLGGAAFRYALGRIIDWLERKQAHKEEMARQEQQERFAAAQHARQQETIRLQHDLGVKEITLKADAAINLEEANAFTEAMKVANQPTGVRWIDGWNGSIRPAAATLSLLIWAGKILEQGFKVTSWDTDLASSILGFYFADRHMGKRSRA